MQHKKCLWFTLVELIVSITILSILWTIAFLSFQAYPAKSRNSTRLTDVKNMGVSLELFKIKTAKYSTPSDSFEVKYNPWTGDETVWTQGSFWESVLTNVSNLSNLPVDPLTGNTYVYSIINTWTEYQLWAIKEGAVSSMTPQTYAADKIAQMYVKWNYNWKWVTIFDPSGTWYILNVPSIISWEDNINLDEIITKKSLCHGWRN